MMQFVQEFFFEILKELLLAVFIPIFIYSMGIIFPFNQTYKTVPFDAKECENLERKRLSGCYRFFIIFAIFITLLHFPFWKPLFDYVHSSIPNILVIIRPTLFDAAILGFYLAVPLTINATNYWFAKKFGENKLIELHSFYSNKYNLNNASLEKWLYRVTLFFAIFLIFALFSASTVLTDKTIRYNNPFSLFSENENIENVESIDHFTGDIAPNGDVTNFSFYIVSFKNGKQWKALAQQVYQAEDIKNIVTIIAQKQNLTIQEKGIQQK